MKREPFYRHFGKRVRKLRTQSGLTQEAVGARLLPPQTRASVANIESGGQRVGLLTVAQLAEIFGCQIADMVPASCHWKGVAP